jgi:hypothetical protein
MERKVPQIAEVTNNTIQKDYSKKPAKIPLGETTEITVLY